MPAVERTVYVVPHTHWDREWYATLETFRAQLVELWHELLALTEADPEFCFLMHGQTVVIDDYLAFQWEAPDGSRILTAYMGNSYSHGVDLPTEPAALAARIAGALKAIEPFHPTADILLMNGNDHVLPQRALSAAVRAASGRLDGTRIRLARLEDYLATLPEREWPIWHGELRSSSRANVLMGTLSVRVGEKQVYAQATRMLERVAEPIAALSRVDAAADLERAWTLRLQNAAHDTACGSGIDAVADESRQRSVDALTIASSVLERALPQLAGDGQAWNPSAFPRGGLVEVGGSLIRTPVISGCSVGLLAGGDPGTSAIARSMRLENALLTCELNPDGTFTVVDRQTGTRYPALHRLVDEGDAGDEYNFSPAPADMPTTSPVRNFTGTIKEEGPARARLEARFDYVVRSGLSQDRRRRADAETSLPVRLALSLEAETPRLDIELDVINRATDHRLRVHFPLPFSATESAADTPFHVTRRPVVAARRDPGSPELALPTYPMWSFVDVSDSRVGLALITDGLHEYEVLSDAPQQLALTLLRAVGWLSRDDLITRTGHAGPALETPGAQVLGDHRFRYSLFFHAGDWERAAVWRAAEAALVPMLPGRGPAVRTPAPGIELEPDCIQLTACIPAPAGFDLRLLNASDQAQVATVRCSVHPAAVTRITLAGELREDLIPEDGVARLSLRPWEIATLRIAR